MIRYLFLSFTGILRPIMNGALSSADVHAGLFYFGCVRDHAMNPWGKINNRVVLNELVFVTSDEAEQRRIHRTIVSALLIAEKSGRAVYRQLKEPMSYEVLNELLDKNGFQTLRFDQYSQPHYNYQTVEAAALEQGLPLKVVWR